MARRKIDSRSGIIDEEEKEAVEARRVERGSIRYGWM